MIEDIFAQLTDRELRNLMTILVFGVIGLMLNGYHWFDAWRDRYKYLAKARLKDTKNRTDGQLLAQPVIEFFGLLGFLILCTIAFLFFALR
jgi:hypothetical protein